MQYLICNSNYCAIDLMNENLKHFRIKNCTGLNLLLYIPVRNSADIKPVKKVKLCVIEFQVLDF